MISLNNVRAWEEINVDNFRYNVKNIKKHIRNTKLMAVIKADAYGHGVVDIAEILETEDVDYLAVACIEEAKQLRVNGVSLPILILGTTSPECVCDLFKYDIIPTVFEKTLPCAISEYAKKTGGTLPVHIKTDTGMGRVGFQCYDRGDNSFLDDILEISKLPGIEIEGIFTHFSVADEETGVVETEKQFDNFMYICETLTENGINIPIKHCANSAAISLYPKMHLDMVRAGIIMYGEYPSEYTKNNTELKIKPVKSLKAMISQVKTVPKGRGISYGQHYKAKEDGEKLAVVCIGYGDNYSRLLSGKVSVLINGQLAPQVGNICMDQMVVDISGIDDVKFGDVAVLVGQSGDKSISYSDIAGILGTINYEIMCDVGKRLTKAYFEGGKCVKRINYLDKL